MTVERKWCRALYQRLLKLRRHQEYAQRVIEATSGAGMTPVMPLATMGCGGGPLLCDVCRRPIVLEGGRFHNVPADQAWAKNPDPTWKSWIKGGMVVELQTNGTVRVYHGYQRNNQDCCQVAVRRDVEARDRHVGRMSDGQKRWIEEFVRDEVPESERETTARELMSLILSYDPGLGVNRPDPLPGEPPDEAPKGPQAAERTAGKHPPGRAPRPDVQADRRDDQETGGRAPGVPGPQF